VARHRRGIFKIGAVYYMKVKDPDGKWRQRSLGTRDYLEATTHFEEVQAGQVPVNPGRAPLFRDYVEDYKKGLIARGRKPRTITSAEDDIRKLMPHFGAMRLNAIGPQHVEAYQAARRAQGLTPATINGELRTLRAILRRALEHKILREMPCKISFLREERKAEPPTFTKEEMDRILGATQEEPRLFMLLLLAKSSAMRIGEILWLEWADIREREDGNEQIIVRSKADGEFAFSPKGHAERFIPLSRSMVLTLKEYRLRLPHGCRWVIPSEDGGRLANPYKGLRAAFRRAGVYKPRKLVHAIRHSMASEWLASGADLETVRSLLGHRHLSTTAIYLHSSEERKRAAIERAEAESPITLGLPPAALGEAFGEILVKGASAGPKSGGPCRNRTYDQRIKSPLLYQLS